MLINGTNFTWAEIIAKAEKAEACEESLNEIKKLLKNKKSVWKHPNMLYWGYWYALNVIKGRWFEAEEFIKKDSEWTYRYARDVIKGRWPKAEEYIKKDSEWAYWYTINIIKGRWFEAEEFIKKDPKWAYFYARYIIKDNNERKEFLGQ